VGEAEKAVEHLEAAAAGATELGDTMLVEDIAAEISRSP
jgi:hypothetical protein